MDPILIDLPESLATDRLLLRPPGAGDGQAMFEAVSESLPELRRHLGFLPWVAAEQTMEASEAHCRNGRASFLARRDLPFLLFERSSGQLVGSVGLLRIDWTVPRFEVGYWGRTSRSGSGFVSEAVLAVTALASHHLHAARIEIVTDETNLASRRVAERCGYALEAILRKQRRASDGTLCNTCIYAHLPP